MSKQCNRSDRDDDEVIQFSVEIFKNGAKFKTISKLYFNWP